MDIIYRKGNLLDAPERVIAHGCNAQGVMGSGVAKAIRDQYPKAYDDYRAQHLSGGLQLGRIVWTPILDEFDNEHRLIANCITQEFYGRDGKRYVDYEAIRSCVRGICQEAKTRYINHMRPYAQNPFYEFAMPKIGAGLGGGNWDEIAKIIEEETILVQAVVYEL